MTSDMAGAPLDSPRPPARPRPVPESREREAQGARERRERERERASDREREAERRDATQSTKSAGRRVRVCGRAVASDTPHAKVRTAKGRETGKVAHSAREVVSGSARLGCHTHARPLLATPAVPRGALAAFNWRDAPLGQPLCVALALPGLQERTEGLDAEECQRASRTC